MPTKEGIRRLFDNIAPSYDKLNHILSLNVDKLWRRKAVKRIVDEDRPLSVLDVACGTADFSIAIASRLVKMASRHDNVASRPNNARYSEAGTGRVTGLDLSEGMLKIGREKVAAAGLAGFVSLETGDCEALPYATESFDRISVAFGVRNFEHIDLGLREMERVLKSGGRLVILELSVPGNPFLCWCYKLYFLKILPKIGKLVSGNKGAYEYLPDSVLKFPDPDKFTAMMREAGFSGIEHKPLTFGLCRMYIGEKAPTQ